MCYSVQIRFDIKELVDRFQISKNLIVGHSSFIEKRILGPSKKDKAPVIYSDGTGLIIEEMFWSLTPPWSKEFPCKWNTYNARLSRVHKGQKQLIFDVPSFKDSFKKNQFCLVPIVGAIEASYWGEAAGHIIEFSIENETSFYGLGLWSEWLDKNTGEVLKSFSLLTDDPYAYFHRYGHDRSLVVSDPKTWAKLLHEKDRPIGKSWELIKKHRIDQAWIHRIDRRMKAGWEKRAPSPDEIKRLETMVWKK
jgi:putative SOS response-associated peptidase YedK